MAQVANPRKVFNFDVEIDGIFTAQVQKVTHPEIEIEQTTHGDTNFDVKTGGRKTISNGTLEKLRPIDEPDLTWWTWLTSVQSTEGGGGVLPSIYKQLITIKEKSVDNVLVLNTWLWLGAWPCKHTLSDHDRNSSDNTITTVEICIDRVVQV